MIPATIESLLRPMEAFEQLRHEVARLGDRLCDLAYANPYDDVAPAARRVLADALAGARPLDLQYTPVSGRAPARRAVADALSVSHDLPFAHTDVALTPGASAALHLALRIVGEPGDEVIIPIPCWFDYPLYVRAVGLVPVMVATASRTCDLDVRAITDAITPRTCAVLLSHPSNPAGLDYAPAMLTALGETLQRARVRFARAVTVIADETHRDYVTGPYRSLASAWPSTLLVYSFGKYHLLQGQRAGYLAVSPRHPQREGMAMAMVRWARITALGAPTALMQAALGPLLRLRHDLAAFHRRRTSVADALAASGYAVVPASATFFLYVATPEGERDFSFVRRLARVGVLVLPADVFHHRGYFRLALTASDAMIERALEVLAAFHGAAAVRP